MKIPKLIFATLLGAAGAVVPAARDAQASTLKVGNIDSLIGGDTISGWACQVGSANSVSIKVYAGQPKTGDVPLVSGSTSIASEPAIGVGCSSTNTALRFQLTIPPAVRAQHVGAKLVAIADNDTTLGGSGDFIIPATNGGAWSFDDVSGTIAKGTYDNGTLVNGPQWTAADGCHSGTCLSFPNNKVTKAYVDVPYSSALKFGTGDFTIAAWVKLAPGTVDTNCITTSRPPGVDQGLVLGVKAGKAEFYAYGVPGLTLITSQKVVADGGWHYLVARRQGIQLSLIVDGKQDGTATVPATYNSDSTSGIFRIGARLNTTDAFVGSIDDVQYLGRALSDDEIQAANVQRSINSSAPAVLGNVDSLTGGGTVSGWACQARSPASLPVQVYAGDPADGGVLLASGTASLPSEPAISTACPSTSSALRFQVTIPANLKATYQDHPLYVTANGTPISQSGIFRLPMTKGSLWAFDEGSGNTANGTLVDGTLVNAPQWTAASQCLVGTCLSFPNNKAQKASVEVPYTNELKFGTGDFTVAARIKTTAAAGENVIAGANQCFVKTGWLLEVMDGRAGISTWGNGAVNGYTTSDVRVDDGAWHHVVARRRGSTVSLIVDGGLATTATVAPTWSSDGNVSVLRIGNLSGCAGREFVGSIDEVQLIGRALTDAELGVEKPGEWGTITLRSLQNNKFVTGGSSSFLFADATEADQGQTLAVRDLGGGVVAFRSSNQKYVRVDPFTAFLSSSAGGIGSTEKFRWVDMGNHRVALRSLELNRYLYAQGTDPLRADHTGIGLPETFEWQRAEIPYQVELGPVSIRRDKRLVPLADDYLTAVQGAPSSKLAVVSTPSPLTKFRFMDEGVGRVSIKSLSTDLYLSAWDPAGQGLIPNAVNVGPWETFELIDLGGGSRFALRSVANRRFVSVTGNSSARVASLTQSATIGDSETLFWIAETPVADPVTGGGFSYLWDKNYGNKDLGLNVWVMAAAANKVGIDAVVGSVTSKIEPGIALRKLLPASSAAASDDFAEVLGSTGLSVTLFSTDISVMETACYKTLGVDYVVQTFAGVSTGALPLDDLEGSLSIPPVVLYEDHYDFMVGPIPVTVSAEIGSNPSSVGVTQSSPGQPNAAIQLTAGLYATAGVGFGNAFASVGVEDTLQFCDESVPLTFGLDVGTGKYYVKAGIDITAISGSLDVYAKLNYGVGELKYTCPIVTASYDNTNVTLLERNGKLE